MTHPEKYLCISVFLGLFFLTNNLFAQKKVLNECKNVKWKPVYQQDFDNKEVFDSDFWYEGTSKVGINEEEGYLYTDCNMDGNGETFTTSTIWLNKVFEGDIRFEFDAHVLKSEGDKNNMNFFLFYSNPGEKSLPETQPDRNSGNYSYYHSLNGYIFTYIANGQTIPARIRLRDNPGFHLLAETYAYEAQQNKTYHIRIEKIGSKLSFSVDGKTYLAATDTNEVSEHQKGYIGFRTWKTELWWDNLVVYQKKVTN